MLKGSGGFGSPHQIHYFASKLAVGNSDPRKIVFIRKIDIHARLCD